MMAGLRLARFAIGLLTLVSAGCGSRGVHTPPAEEIIAPPAPSEIEAVFFLVGDPGEAMEATSPLLSRIRADVELWSGRLDTTATVAVLILGDIVYPDGMDVPGSTAHDADTAVIMSQVRLVTGPHASAHGAAAYFIPGNHDWGLEGDWKGHSRLRALETFLRQTRIRTGADVRLVPTAGSGGPELVDLERFRVVILDTAWWLLEGDPVERQRVLARIEAAFATAGSREILIAAHHPFRSAGPHGGGMSIWEALGVRYLLFRSGAILQDITSRPYRELEFGLRRIIDEYGPPLAFIGGHDHSLQVIEAIEPTDPTKTLISGSASKLSEVRASDGLIFGRAEPGYMRMILDRNGQATLYVEAAPREFMKCPESEPRRSLCMTDGFEAFRTVFSSRLE